jgi:hypothetical protein
MRWQCLAASAMVIVALVGCQSDPPQLGAQGPPPMKMGPDGQPVPLSRSQKPEPENKPALPKSLLDKVPEHIGDEAHVSTGASIRAVVNGHAILNEEVREACYAALRQTMIEEMSPGERLTKQKEILTAALDMLIERELLLEDAFAKLEKNPEGKKFLDHMKDEAAKQFKEQLRSLKKALNIKSDDDLKAWMLAQGITFAGAQRQKERQFIAEEYLRQVVMPRVDRVGHEEIVDYYQQHPEEFQVSDAVKWQDFLIDATDASRYPNREAARQAAQWAVNRARAREDFERLAEQFNPGDFRFTKGEGYGQKRGEIRPPEAEPVLFSMSDGDAAVVEVPLGFHVLKLVKRDHAGLMPLDDKLQTQLRNKLRTEVGIREQKRFLNQLKRKAVIEYSSAVP